MFVENFKITITVKLQLTSANHNKEEKKNNIIFHTHTEFSCGLHFEKRDYALKTKLSTQNELFIFFFYVFINVI